MGRSSRARTRVAVTIWALTLSGIVVPIGDNTPAALAAHGSVVVDDLSTATGLDTASMTAVHRPERGDIVMQWRRTRPTPWAGVSAAIAAGPGDTTQTTTALATGDLDGDGDLDLVAGNQGAINRVYLNDGTANPFTGAGTDLGTSATDTRAIAVGDLDLDGDLDLVVANNGVNELYLNNGTAAPFVGVAAVPLPGVAGDSTSIALGDIDLDGDLDIVVGNLGATNRMHLNDGTGSFSDGELGPEVDDTHAIAFVFFSVWDPYPSVVVGNDGVNRLYANQWDTTFTVSDLTADVADTRALIVADIDGDGSSDIVVGNHGAGEANRLYSRQFPWSPWAGSDITADAHPTHALAVADLDEDGDLDVLAGNTAMPTRVYLNTGSETPFAGIAGSNLTADAVTTSLLASDVSGDHRVDVVVGRSAAVNHVLRNVGSVSPFSAQTNLAAGIRNSTSLASGDLNGDGFEDVVSGTNAGGATSRVHLSNGAGGFTASNLTTDVFATRGVAIGDIDSDGDLDVVTANAGTDRNRIYRNDGTGTFTGGDLHTDAEGSTSIALGDLDGDGDLDAVVGNTGSTVNRVYVNDGTGTFASQPLHADAFSTNMVVIADLDRDGDLDVVSADNPGTDRVYLNDGAMVFTASDLSADTGATRGLAVGDVDRDGDLDVVAARNGAARNRVYLNNGAASFTGSDLTIDAHNSSSVALGDIDHDGDLDAVVGNLGTQGNRLYLNDGSAAPFASAVGVNLTADTLDTWAVLFVDTDREGDLDVVSANVAAADRVYRNAGTPDPYSGTEVRRFGPDVQELAVGTGDFNRDGHVDVVTGRQFGAPATVYLNNGTPDPFAGVVGAPLAGAEDGPLDVADIDGNGTLDILVSNISDPTQPIRAHLNDGSAVFTPVVLFTDLEADGVTPRGTPPSAIRTADLDNDGLLDVVLAAGRASGTGVSSVYFNDGGGTFTAIELGGSYITIDASLADFDKDGDLDILLALEDHTYHPDRLFLNDGARAFTESDLSADLTDTTASAAADVNGDGNPDVVTLNIGTNVSMVYLGDGSSAPFAGGASYAMFDDQFHTDLAVGDVDRDGDPDVLAPASGPTHLWLNDGTPQPFTQTQRIFSEGYIGGAVAIADLDNDGDLDGTFANRFVSGINTAVLQQRGYVTHRGRVTSASPAAAGVAISSATIIPTATLPLNTSIEYWLSNDNGVRWYQAQPGRPFAFPTVGTQQLRWRADLTSSTPGASPSLSAVTLWVNQVDHGDAPDSYGTLDVSDGARHLIGTLRLGAFLDDDHDGFPTATADGDDLDGLDDEDGVVFTSGLAAGGTADVDVEASSDALLDAWVDFNGNGSFGDAGEQVFASEPVVAGVNSLQFPVPAGAVSGDTFSRFRLSSAGGLAPIGLAADGEVEDHPVTIAAGADLSISVTDSADPIVAGSSLTYTVTVANNGPLDADDVVVTDTLPAGVTFVSSSGCTEDPNGVPTCTLGTIANGASAQFTVDVTVDPDTVGTITNSVTVSSSTAEANAGDETATEDTVVTAEAGISISVDDGATSAVPGQDTVTYTIVVANGGPSTDPAVSVADTFPADLTCTYTAVASGGATGHTASGAGDLAETLSMPPGSDVTYTVTCDIDPAATGTLSNTATATASVTDPSAGDDSSTDGDTVLSPEADIQISVDDGTTSAVPGQDTVTYTVVVTNDGPSTDPSVSLTDAFPTDLTCAWTSVAAGSATGNTASGSGDLAETLGMPPGSSVTYTATCDIDPSATGTLSNTAAAAGSVTDPVTGNESSTDGDTELTPHADISVSVSDGLTAAVPGQDTVTYTVVVSNNGPSTDPAVSLADSFPPGLDCTYTSVGAGGVAGNTASGAGDLAETLSMPPGSSATYTVSCAIDPSTTGTLSNTVTATGSVFDPAPGDESATDGDTVLTPEADISVTVDDGATSAVPGQDTVTYTVVVSNAGPSTDPNVGLTDTWPTGLDCTWTAAAAGGASGHTASGTGDLAEALNLPPGSTVTYTASCTIDPSATGTLSNTVTASTSVTETSPGDESATDGDTVLTPLADLTVSQGVNPTTPVAGEQATFTITVTNNGPSDAVDVVTTDTLPPGVTFVSSTGCAEDPSGVPTCTLGTVPAGTTASYTFVVDIDIDTREITNQVSVASTTPDPNGGNESDSTSFTVRRGANRRPVAVDDEADTDEDTPIEFTGATALTGNDRDADRDGLTITEVSPRSASGGRVTLVDGVVTYAPAPDFHGVDTFTYTIVDGHGGSDTATVTVTVAPINDAPVAVDFGVPGERHTPVDIPAADLVGGSRDVDGDELTVIAVDTTSTNGGTIVFDGVTITYTPPRGFLGTDTFTFTLSDGKGGTDTATVTVTVTSDDLTIRIAGPDRIATAIAVSTDSFADGSAQGVVLARSDIAADAIPGAPFAAAMGGPLLLTQQTSLPEPVLDEIRRVLGPSGNVWLLGGPNAVSPAVADALTDAGYTPQRLAGPSRIETAVAIADAVPSPSTVFLVRGDEWPDGITAGVTAAQIGAVVLLTLGPLPHVATDDWLASHPDLPRWAIGGDATRAYPDEMAIAGPTRIQTAIGIANTFMPGRAIVGLARADDFADALAAGPHLARHGGPLLITFPTDLHDDVAAWLEVRAGNLGAVFLFGGPNALSPQVEEEIDAILEE